MTIFSKEIVFNDSTLGRLEMSVGAYTSYEGEDNLYYLAVEGEDDFLIQYDSLSLDHVEAVFDVVRIHTRHEDFIKYFCEYCKLSYLVNRLDL